MSGLKPGPISGANARARANANAKAKAKARQRQRQRQAQRQGYSPGLKPGVWRVLDVYWWLVKTGVRTPWKVTAVLSLLLVMRVGYAVAKRGRSAARGDERLTRA
jgi:hypothetical protein